MLRSGAIAVETAQDDDVTEEHRGYNDGDSKFLQILSEHPHRCSVSVIFLCHLLCLSQTSSELDPMPNRSDSVDACIHALQTSHHTQIVDNTVNLTLIKTQFKVTRAKPESLSEIILLIWTWPFGVKFDSGACSSLLNIEGCRFTDDRNLFNKAHSVFFHHRDISYDMPKLPRPSFQKWIWMNMESPSNSIHYSHLNDVFNLTASYRQDSDVTVPYGRISERRAAADTSYKIPHKEKLVCWIVSNWNPEHERSKYYVSLKEHINVETHGSYFTGHISDEDSAKLMSSCKFYLLFENSIHEDYITEKVFRAMTLGTVPVVLGPPRKNYEKFIPADAFIHVNDFRSAEELAAHLDQNTHMYMKYFSWREDFTVTLTWFGLEHACRACDHIRRERDYRCVTDLSSWYWGL